MNSYKKLLEKFNEQKDITATFKAFFNGIVSNYDRLMLDLKSDALTDEDKRELIDEFLTAVKIYATESRRQLATPKREV